MDNIKRQQHYQAWQQEHRSPTLLALASTQASPSVTTFLRFASSQGLTLGKRVLDIGCGKGRNALALAQQGFSVTAFDIVEEAIMILKARAQAASLNITAHKGAMDELWPYPDNSFDIILDDTASLSIGYLEGMIVCRNEMCRVLTPGGYAIIDAITSDDPFLQQFPPGPEPQTVITPDGKIERFTSPQQIQTFYAMFIPIHQEQRSDYDTVTGTGERRMVWTLLQKPDR